MSLGSVKCYISDGLMTAVYTCSFHTVNYNRLVSAVTETVRDPKFTWMHLDSYMHFHAIFFPTQVLLNV
jgi:hypothetical protein